jgi:hypothetical protein
MLMQLLGVKNHRLLGFHPQGGEQISTKSIQTTKQISDLFISERLTDLPVSIDG